jgi:hypothetical protein
MKLNLLFLLLSLNFAFSQEYSQKKNLGDVPKYESFNWGSVLGDVTKALENSEKYRQANRDFVSNSTNENINYIQKTALKSKSFVLNKLFMDCQQTFIWYLNENDRMVRSRKIDINGYKLFNNKILNYYNQFYNYTFALNNAVDYKVGQGRTISMIEERIVNTIGNGVLRMDSNNVFILKNNTQISLSIFFDQLYYSFSE